MATQTKETTERNREIVEKVNAAFSENKTEDFLSYCADDVTWRMIGDKTVSGVDGIREFMKSMGPAEPPKFTVDHLIADGDMAAAYGNMTMADENGKTTPYSYCDIYRFSDGKIVELNSFVVKTGEKDAE